MKHTSPGAARAVCICAALALLVPTSCSPRRVRPSSAKVTGPTFELDLVPGPHYADSFNVLFLRIPHYPQVACWIETTDGAYLGTIYVTRKTARMRWFGAPKAGRPEALPVWAHARTQASLGPDAVSGATSAGTVRVESPAGEGLAAGTYVVKLEVNSSFDYNERYTRANSGVNGQPSIIYSGRIDVGKGETEADLAPIGTGSVDGSNGNITPGLAGITTAAQILQSARVIYHDR